MVSHVLETQADFVCARLRLGGSLHLMQIPVAHGALFFLMLLFALSFLRVLVLACTLMWQSSVKSVLCWC